MTTPIIEPDLLLDPREEGIDEEEAERRRVVARQSLVALIDSWIEEAENMTDEERRQAERDWEEFARAIDEDRLPGQKLYS
jgi:hypothetical protein